jgi:hypothetical protein
LNPIAFPARSNARRWRAATPPAVALAFVLVACSAGSTSSASPTQNASSSLVASESAAASIGSAAASPSEEPTQEPSDNLGDFTCSFPETGPGTVARAQITDVRVGTHDGYDRVVFEFGSGIPQFKLAKATAPLTQDPSGLPLDVKGNVFWQLVMQGGTKVSPTGPVTYDGDTDFTPGFPKLVELIEGGDFEAVSTWYFGLRSASCVRVITLAAPSRLVIDIQH